MKSIKIFTIFVLSILLLSSLIFSANAWYKVTEVYIHEDELRESPDHFEIYTIDENDEYILLEITDVEDFLINHPEKLYVFVSNDYADCYLTTDESLKGDYDTKMNLYVSLANDVIMISYNPIGKYIIIISSVIVVISIILFFVFKFLKKRKKEIYDKQ